MTDKIVEKDLDNGILEAQGSEEFVQSQIDELFASKQNPELLK